MLKNVLVFVVVVLSITLLAGCDSCPDGQELWTDGKCHNEAAAPVLKEINTKGLEEGLDKVGKAITPKNGGVDLNKAVEKKAYEVLGSMKQQVDSGTGKQATDLLNAQKCMGDWINGACVK